MENEIKKNRVLMIGEKREPFCQVHKRIICFGHQINIKGRVANQFDEVIVKFFRHSMFPKQDCDCRCGKIFERGVRRGRK